MKVLRYNYLTAILLACLFAGCGGYNKLLKNPDPAKRYSAALNYYNAGKYAKVAPLMESLDMVYSGRPEDDTVHFYTAKSYFLMSDYYTADMKLESFVRIFGLSPFLEEATYLRAVNLYRMSSRSELDQAATLSAISSFSEFNSKYPNSKFGEKDTDYYNELMGRLEEKSYLSAKLYYQIEDYKAAIIALRNSIKDYPKSKYNEEQSFLVLKASYIYAKRSVRKMQADRYISAIDEYYNFISEYPDSQYTKEAESMYKDALAYTNKRGINIEDEIDR